MAPAMQSPPAVFYQYQPQQASSEPDRQLTIWSSLPNPTTPLKGPESAFAQTQMEPQPRRLVLCPGTSVSLPTYLQVPTPRSKKTQTLYTHLSNYLQLLMRHPCFHDRLKGKRLWALFCLVPDGGWPGLDKQNHRGVTGASQGQWVCFLATPGPCIYGTVKGQHNRPNTDGLRWGPGQGRPRDGKAKAHTYQENF